MIIRLWNVKGTCCKSIMEVFLWTNHCNEIGERLLVVAQLIALKKLEPLSWGHSHGSFTHDDPMIQVGFSICPTCMHNCSFQEYIRNPQWWKRRSSFLFYIVDSEIRMIKIDQCCCQPCGLQHGPVWLSRRIMEDGRRLNALNITEHKYPPNIHGSFPMGSLCSALGSWKLLL